MKKETHFRIAFSLFVYSMIYIQSISAQVKLPDTWQPSMKLTVYTGPGMQPDSWTTVICNQGGYIVYNDGTKIKKTNIVLTKNELDTLISVLFQRNLHLMEGQSSSGIIDDMRTTSITLEWDGKIVGASIGASAQLPEKYKEDFSEILIYIQKLADKNRKRR